MPKARDNFILLYWDKVLLLALAAVGAYVFIGRVISSPIKIDGSAGSKQTPEQLVEDVYDLAKQLEDEMNRSVPPEVEPISYTDAVRLRLQSGIPLSLPRNALTLQGVGVEELPGLAQIATPPVLAPINVQVRAGIGLLAVSTRTRAGFSSAQPVTEESGKEAYWVTVAAEFPFYKQCLAFAGLDPLVDEARRLSPEDQRFLFARLDLQRQELLPDGSWSNPEDVNPYEFYSPALPNTVKSLAELYSLSSADEQSDNVDVLKSWLMRAGFQEFIARPEFFALDGFEQWYWPEQAPDLTDSRSSARTLAGETPNRDEAPRYRTVRTVSEGATSDRAGQLPLDRSLPMLAPGTAMPLPPGREGFVAPEVLAPRTVERTTSSQPAFTGTMRAERLVRDRIPREYSLENAPKNITIWAHDNSAKPGSTYRYRMRVLLFNPLCADERAENNKVRTLSWLQGPWSAWSGPVQTFQKKCFYFTDVSPARGSRPPRARVTVYAWQDGWWYEHLFFYSDAAQTIGEPRDVPDFVPAEEGASTRTAAAYRSELGTFDRRPAPTRRETRPEGPAPRPRVTVDFTTDWTIIDFTPEVQLDQPIGEESADLETVDTAELVVMKQATQQLVKRYTAVDNDDSRRKELEQTVARQEKAFKDKQRELAPRTRSRLSSTPEPSRRRLDLGFPGLPPRR